jgi:hypothetical protein
MTTTFIDTNELPREKTPVGEMTEVLNQKLADAKNVKAIVRWVDGGKTFEASPADRHQLVYFMEGAGKIRLEGKDYDVRKGGGVYLKPSEGASITADGSLKLFHLVVPQIPA